MDVSVFVELFFLSECSEDFGEYILDLKGIIFQFFKQPYEFLTLVNSKIAF